MGHGDGQPPRRHSCCVVSRFRSQENRRLVPFNPAACRDLAIGHSQNNAIKVRIEKVTLGPVYILNVHGRILFFSTKLSSHSSVGLFVGKAHSCVDENPTVLKMAT